MKETLIIAIILGAFALLASLRAARLDAANAAKPRRNGRTGGKESAGKGAEQGRLRPTILRTAAVGMAVLAIGHHPDDVAASPRGGHAADPRLGADRDSRRGRCCHHHGHRTPQTQKITPETLNP